MILVVGATGILGGDICRRLRGRGLDVRGLVRAGSTNESALRDIGVEICTGDLRTRASVEAACAGVATIISTATAMGSKDKGMSLRAVDHDGQLRLVEIAKATGVAQFVFISASPALHSGAPLIRYKREVERAVRASGMRWTILQPSCFMDVWLSDKLGWDFAAGTATIFGAGTAPVSYISASDVAEVAVRSIDDPRLADRDVPLGGPENLSPNQVLAIFEEAAGRRYKVKRVPRPLLALMSPVVALFDEGAASGMSFGAQTALGDVIDSPLQRQLALPLTSVRDYAARVVIR